MSCIVQLLTMLMIRSLCFEVYSGRHRSSLQQGQRPDLITSQMSLSET